MEVEVHLFKANNKQKDITGILKEYTDEDFTILIDDENTIKFDKKDVALIRLAFDF